MLLWQRLLFWQLLWLCVDEFGFFFLRFFKRFFVDERDLRNWPGFGLFFWDLLSNWSQSGLLFGTLESRVFNWNELNDGFLGNGKSSVLLSCSVLLLHRCSELDLGRGSSWGLGGDWLRCAECLSEFFLNRDGTEHGGFSGQLGWSKNVI